MGEASSTFTAADGDGYELQMGRWSRCLAQPFVEFAGISAARHVLDVGCGTGSLTHCLARQPGVASATGVDISPIYVAYAQKRNENARVQFRVGDACDLPFPEGSFDHALSMLVLQFVPKAERAVREMQRVTRSGGTVAAATWDSAGGLIAQRLVFDTAALVDPGGNAARAAALRRLLSRPTELARLWQASGLLNVVQSTLTTRMDFASFEDFWTLAEVRDGPVAQYVRTLDANVRCELKAAVEQAYLVGDADGPRSFAATAWVVKGKVA
jgi:SAM-dependent methyltransferase